MVVAMSPANLANSASEVKSAPGLNSTGAYLAMAFVAIPGTILVLGFCGWLASKIFGGKAGFGQALGLNTGEPGSGENRMEVLAR